VGGPVPVLQVRVGAVAPFPVTRPCSVPPAAWVPCVCVRACVCVCACCACVRDRGLWCTANVSQTRVSVTLTPPRPLPCPANPALPTLGLGSWADFIRRLQVHYSKQVLNQALRLVLMPSKREGQLGPQRPPVPTLFRWPRSMQVCVVSLCAWAHGPLPSVSGVRSVCAVRKEGGGGSSAEPLLHRWRSWRWAVSLRFWRFVASARPNPWEAGVTNPVRLGWGAGGRFGGSTRARRSVSRPNRFTYPNHTRVGACASLCGVRDCVRTPGSFWWTAS
jgi:hypothetical protein